MSSASRPRTSSRDAVPAAGTAGGVAVCRGSLVGVVRRRVDDRALSAGHARSGSRRTLSEWRRCPLQPMEAARLLVRQDLAGLIVAVDGGGPVTVLPGTHLAARGTTVFTS